MFRNFSDHIIPKIPPETLLQNSKAPRGVQPCFHICVSQVKYDSFIIIIEVTIVLFKDHTRLDTLEIKILKCQWQTFPEVLKLRKNDQKEITMASLSEN